MSAMIEERVINGKSTYSFAEHGAKQRAWHGLGDDQQIFDRPMFVKEALEACHANYNVQTNPVAVMTDEVLNLIKSGKSVDSETLKSLFIPNTMATIRTDINAPLGIVSDKYGVVSNELAFKFVDTLCSGNLADRDNTPVIETCGVLGKGERVFVTAKFPKQVVLDAKRDDLMDMYVIFTTSHDGTGAVRCVVSGVRVVCNNTLQLALQKNIGRISFRHTSNVTNRLDLLNQENTDFAYRTLNLAEVYTNALKESYDRLRNINLTEKDINNVLAEIALAEDSKKIFLDTNNIYHNDIPTRGRNIFLGLRECLETGIGQDIQDRGTAQWMLNGITSYYQNVQNYRNEETKFDSIFDGNVNKKVQKAYDLLSKVAA